MPRTAVIQQDGSRIRELREEAGLTQAQFAKRIDCNPDYVSAFELGHKKHISKMLFHRICRVLGVENKNELKRRAA